MKSVKFRADFVLFKEDFPEKLVCDVDPLHV